MLFCAYGVSAREGTMSALAQHINEMDLKSFKPCKCGRPYELVRSMLNIHTRKQVRMFECKACGERTWDE